MTKEKIERINKLTVDIKSLAAEKKQLEAELIESFNIDLNSIGTRSHEIDGYEIKVTIGKDVEWNQDELRKLKHTISIEGGNPDEYIETSTSYKVGEVKYKSWPSTISNKFDHARTVKPKKPKLEIKESK